MQQIIDLNLRKINKIVRKPLQFLVTIVVEKTNEKHLKGISRKNVLLN